MGYSGKGARCISNEDKIRSRLCRQLAQTGLRRRRRRWRRGGREQTFRERYGHLEQTTLPDGLFLAWNATFPNLQVEDTLLVALGFGEEPERVVLAPLLAVSRVTS